MASETQARPLLISGDRLSQPEFHRLYEQMPRNFRARLIDGIVFSEGDGDGVASPVSELHGKTTKFAGFWMTYYQTGTPGVLMISDGTLVLGVKNEPQPDQMMYLCLIEGGGRAASTASSTASPNSWPRSPSRRWRSTWAPKGSPTSGRESRNTSSSAQIREIFWHVLRDGVLGIVPPDADGIYLSRTFPGLWLDPHSFWAERAWA